MVIGRDDNHCWRAFQACSCCFCVEILKALRRDSATSGPNMEEKVWRRKEVRSMELTVTTEPNGLRSLLLKKGGKESGRLSNAHDSSCTLLEIEAHGFRMSTNVPLNTWM